MFGNLNLSKDLFIKRIQKDILAITPGQNYCYILTLGNPHKPVILIIARQHPG
jgi:hypothetical protein